MENPSGILKHTLSNEEHSINEFLNRKPFKLRFGKQHEIGRSTVSSTKPFGFLPIISPKFYSKEMINTNENCLKRVDKLKTTIDNLYDKRPLQNLKLPTLESHKYGWYNNIKFSDRSFYDSKYHFGIKVSPMVKYRLLILSENCAESKRPAITKTKS